MPKHHDKIRIGTCSWKYPEWHGLVYSAPKGIDYLAEYSRKYSTVEIDQWFWSLFSPETGAKMPTACRCPQIPGCRPRRLPVFHQGPQQHHPDPLLQKGQRRQSCA